MISRLSNHTLLMFAMAVCAVWAGCSTETSVEMGSAVGSLALSFGQQEYFLRHDGSVSDIAVPFEAATPSLSLTVQDASGRYRHTWNSIADFPQDEDLFTGMYSLTVSQGNVFTEGFDTPTYSASQEVIISEGVRTDARMELMLSNSTIVVGFGEGMSQLFARAEVSVHTAGSEYFTFAPDDARLLCVVPGKQTFYLDIVMTDGREVMFETAVIPDAIAGALYEYNVDAAEDNGLITIHYGIDGQYDKVSLTDSFLDAAVPTVGTSWNQQQILDLPEGDKPQAPVEASVVKDGASISHLYLSVHSLALNSAGIPAECDLLNLSPHDSAVFDQAGLTIREDEEVIVVNFDRLLSQLVYLDDETDITTVSLMAVGPSGRCSAPAVLKVRSLPVGIEILDVGESVMGVDRATIKVACPQTGFPDHVAVDIEVSPAVWERVPLDKIIMTSPGEYEITFKVPAGNEPVSARVLYCDEVRTAVTIPRVMPAFEIDVDAFATMAAVRVIPEDPSLLKVITSGLYIYLNNVETSLYMRLPDKGIVSVVGLSPSTRYAFKATMMQGADPTFTKEVVVNTESTPQLPNSDFEERREGVRYKHLPSGGRYSQTTVEIFNWQHHTDYDQEVPKEWATTNAKTFCKAAENHNTWYMQPSVFLVRDDAFSQSFSVQMVSVAYDLKGEEIPDYAQTGQPYLDYSPIIPRISCRAAGKLFLGSYSFDPATGCEVYDEGIAWPSRPISLNGYYKFLPSDGDRSDAGMVSVQVLGNIDGEEVMIASGQMRLMLASSFTAFSVPLSYDIFGVKASKIKVMFSSSAHTGSTGEETASVTTVPDPITATSTGGRLWIDNVTLAY